jgi:uncharacterized protein YegJ (DUF2314 family)
MSENRIFYSEADQDMLNAFQKAQETFKYFWRELSWEYRRIIPGLGVACVKVAFKEETEDPGKPLVEHMWINEVEFDGDTISGVLVNDPNALSNVKNGDFIEVPLTQVSDWLFAFQGKTYGGFTIQMMRSKMNEEEREDHDNAWSLEFGDYRNILLVTGQAEHPEHLIEHPMSVNMKDSLIDFLKENPDALSQPDDKGYTLLHRETIAGNQTSVEVLLKAGADKHSKTHTGKSALDFAKQLQWSHLIPLLES